MLRKAPKDADSVGVMIPPKIVPSTRTMTPKKGNISKRALSLSRRVNFGFGRAKLGLRITKMVTVRIKSEARMIPGITPPAKSRATETSCQPPYTIRMTLGGMRTLNVPEMAIEPRDSLAS